MEIESTKENLELARQEWEMKPESDKAMERVFALYGKLIDLNAELHAGTRRLTRQITAIEQQEIEKRAANWQKYWDWIEDENKKKDDAEKKRIKDNYEFYKDYWDWFQDNVDKAIAAEKKSKEAWWDFNMDISRKLFEQNKKLAKEQWEEIMNVPEI